MQGCYMVGYFSKVYNINDMVFSFFFHFFFGGGGLLLFFYSLLLLCFVVFKG